MKSKHSSLASSAINGLLWLSSRGTEDVSTKTVDPGDMSSLVVRGDVRSVTARSEERDTVHVRAVKRAVDKDALEQITLDIDRNGDAIELVADRDYKLSLFGFSPIIDLELALPAALQLAEIDSGFGAVEITGVRGPLTVDTGAGSTEIAGVRGDLNMSGGSGNYRVEDIAGSVVATVGSGTLSAKFDSLKGGDVTLKTGSGDIAVTIAEAADAQVTLSSGSGVVEATVPAVGGVSSDSFTTTLGDGTRALEASAGSGDVELIVESRGDRTEP